MASEVPFVLPRRIELRDEINRLIAIIKQLIAEEVDGVGPVYLDPHAQIHAFVKIAAQLIMTYNAIHLRNYDMTTWLFLLKGDYELETYVNAENLDWARILLLADEIESGGELGEQEWCEEGWMTYAAAALTAGVIGEGGQPIYDSTYDSVFSIWAFEPRESTIFSSKPLQRFEFTFHTIESEDPHISTVDAPNLEYALLRLLSWDVTSNSDWPCHEVSDRSYEVFCELASELNADTTEAKSTYYQLSYRILT